MSSEAEASTRDGQAVEGDFALPLFQPLALKSGLSLDQPKVGDTLVWSIDLTRPGDVSIKLPTKLNLSPFTLNAVRHETRPLPADSPLASTKAVVEHFELEVGVYTLEGEALPALTFQASTPQGEARVVVPGPSLQVSEALDPKVEEARALAPPVQVWTKDYSLLYGLGGIVAALLLILMVWKLLRRRRRGRASAPTELAAPRPCDAIALEALNALSQEGLLNEGKRKHYFFRLSEIVRVYLGARFQFEALEATTEELLLRLRDRSTPGLDYASFESWCLLGDQVKFARLVPSDAECKASMELALALVQKTTSAALEAALVQQARASELGVASQKSEGERPGTKAPSAEGSRAAPSSTRASAASTQAPSSESRR